MNQAAHGHLDIERRRQSMEESFRRRFKSEPQIAVRAPGRVDLMGSHTDYNQGFVLTLPIDRDTWILASPSDEDRVELVSMNLDSTCDFSVGDENRVSGWGAYVQGVAYELAQAGFPVGGLRGVVQGTIPLGSGLSSSASLEAAVATLFERIGGFTISGLEKARLCQRAENGWVGVHCGILDQYSSILGEPDAALLLDCRDLTHQVVGIPSDLSPVICDTRVPRELAGSEYGQRRSSCEQAAEYLATVDPRIGSLRDVTLELLNAQRDRMEECMYRRARFVIEENARVHSLAEALQHPDRKAIGQVMAASFAGARDLFEISVPAMQAMFDVMNTAPGIVGCRQAGAGFGGCMIALVESDRVQDFCTSVEESYLQSTGIKPAIDAVQTAPGAGSLEGFTG